MAVVIEPGSLAARAPRLHGHPLLRGRGATSLLRDVDTARRFAVEQIRPQALEIDRRMAGDPNAFPWELVRAGGRIGLLNLCLPRVSGGDSDRFCLRTSLVIEEVAAGCGGIATVFGAHALGITPLLVSGAGHWDGVMRDLARSALSGERPLIMACAITEPGAGTDVEHHVHVRTAKLATMAGHQGPASTLDFVGRKDFGTYIVDSIFKPGMAEPWPDFIKEAFGVPFSPDAFVSEVQ